MPDQNQTPAPAPEFISSFPEYTACATLNPDAPLFRAGDPAKGLIPGNKRVDIAVLRCQFLFGRREELGFRRVFAMPNYADCRVDSGFDLNEVLSKAYAAYGPSAKQNIGFIQEVITAIEDRQASGEDTSSLSFVETLVNSLANFPQPGDPARTSLESAVSLARTMAEAIVSILKKAIPGAEKYGDDIFTILMTGVDMLFFVGDYVSTTKSFMRETASRFLSEDRTKSVDDAYAKNYGGYVPSMVTTRAWCAAGKAANDLYLRPGGSGKFDRALAEYNAAIALTTDAAKVLERTFGAADRNSRAKFYAVLNIIGGWLAAYDLKEEVLESSFNTYDTIFDQLRFAFKQQNGQHLRRVVTKVTLEPDLDAFKKFFPVEARAATILECDFGNCDTDFWIPFWADTKAGNWNIATNKTITDPNIRAGALSKATDATFSYWATATAKRSLSNRPYRDWQGVSLDTFARDVLPVWDMLQAWASAIKPYWGRMRRSRLIQYALTGYAPDEIKEGSSYPTNRFDGSPGTLFWNQRIGSGKSWAQTFLWVVSGKDNLGNAPNPNDPAFKANVWRCPGGANDVSCLPCDVIKSRRPIGAKAVEVPMAVEWKDQAKWRAALVAANFPGYYIDCLEKDVVWLNAPITGFIYTPTLTAVGTVTGTGKMNGVDRNRVSSGSFASVPVSGDSIAPKLIDALRGITAPVVAEIASAPTLPVRRR